MCSEYQNKIKKIIYTMYRHYFVDGMDDSAASDSNTGANRRGVSRTLSDRHVVK